jgi:hypothetical protein
MRKYFAAAVLVVLVGAATAQARVDFNVNIAVPVPVYPAPAATVDSYPDYGAQVGYVAAPQFIYSPRLGFYVSVGLPHDIAYINNSYYLYRDGYWYLSPSYRGPWSPASRQWLPAGLHKHRYEQIRYYRDLEYRSYLRDRDHYRGRWYRPVEYRDRDGRRDYRKDYREHRREERKDHRDDRRDDRRDNRRDNRRDDRRDDRR